MKQNKAFKFRTYPTEKQKIIFAKTFGCTRFIYNLESNYLKLPKLVDLVKIKQHR